MMLDKMNYALTMVVKRLSREKVLIQYVGICSDNTFIVCARVAGINFEYGYNGNNKIIITCKGNILDEIEVE